MSKLKQRKSNHVLWEKDLHVKHEKLFLHNFATALFCIAMFAAFELDIKIFFQRCYLFRAFAFIANMQILGLAREGVILFLSILLNPRQVLGDASVDSRLHRLTAGNTERHDTDVRPSSISFLNHQRAP